MEERTPGKWLDEFVALARELSADPARHAARGGWGLDEILAHVASNNQLIGLSVAGALNGGAREYRNDGAIEEAWVRAVVESAGGTEALLEAVERSGRALIALLESADPRLDRDIHVHIRDGDRVVVDEPWSCRALLASNGPVHLRLHLRQLRALAGG